MRLLTLPRHWRWWRCGSEAWLDTAGSPDNVDVTVMSSFPWMFMSDIDVRHCQEAHQDIRHPPAVSLWQANVRHFTEYWVHIIYYYLVSDMIREVLHHHYVAGVALIGVRLVLAISAGHTANVNHQTDQNLMIYLSNKDIQTRFCNIKSLLSGLRWVLRHGLFWLLTLS